jgi:ABC-type transport system involved in multi-copper enzyme maturation permease subunit
LLFHATRVSELQVRRTFGVLGYLWLAAAVAVVTIPFKDTTAEARFLSYGFTCFLLALFFLLPFVRNETDATWRERTLAILGLAGAALALTGFIGGNVRVEFLIPSGLLLAVLGLAYLWAFAGLIGTADDRGYRAGMAFGAVGTVVFLVALGRSLFQTGYLVPSGLLMMGLGLVYAAMAAGLCSDRRLVVLTRRELAAFFYSPIAYIVLLALAFVGWVLFYMFVGRIVEQSQMGPPMVEPIIRYYIIDWFPVICVLFLVPVLTMRLLSEEQRTGTLEMLLTAPVDEVWVVLSKFLAALVFYMVLWLPWGLFLVALRVQGGETFDYRPLLSFFIALFVSGAHFLSMGLFFSSLTRNQIVASMLTFVGMLALLVIFFIQGQVPETSAWKSVLGYASYIELWINSLEGKLSPRYLMFHLSATAFWLFLTVKFMEARRWK